MKKFFYLAATAILSVSLFTACSDDDDDVKTNEEGYIIKNVTFADGKGASEANPLTGDEIGTITGTGFTSSATRLYVRPKKAATNRAVLTDDAVAVTIETVTTTSVKFIAPNLEGTYDFLQKEGNDIYILGNIYLKEKEVVPEIRYVSKFETEDVNNIIFEYTENKLTSIKKNKIENGIEKLETSFNFSYSGNDITIERKEIIFIEFDENWNQIYSKEPFVTVKTQYKVSPTSVTQTIENYNYEKGVIKGSVLRTINYELNNGILKSGKEDIIEKIGEKFVGPEEWDWEEIFGTATYNSTFTYNDKGNLTHHKTVRSVPEQEDKITLDLTYFYDDKSPILNTVSLPAWFWATQDATTLLQSKYMGNINNILAIRDDTPADEYLPPMPEGRNMNNSEDYGENPTLYEYVYDSKGYPIIMYIDGNKLNALNITY